jgi:hypothetical protein
MTGVAPSTGPIESRITAKLRAFVDFAAPRLHTRLTSAAI